MIRYVLPVWICCAVLLKAAVLYDGGGTIPSDWHEAANWTLDAVPGASDDVEINRNQYAGNIDTTGAISLNSFLFKNGANNQTITIGNDFSTADTGNTSFQILANNNGISKIVVQNSGTRIDVAGDMGLRCLTGGGNQAWKLTAKAGTQIDVGGQLWMGTTASSVNDSVVLLYGATVNVDGNLLMEDNTTNATIQLSYKQWNSAVNVGGTATLAGALLIQEGLSVSEAQYTLLNVTSTDALIGGFDNVTFGETTYTNNAGTLYRLDLTALDGDGIPNDIVLRSGSPVPEIQWFPSVSPTAGEDFRSVLGALQVAGWSSVSNRYELTGAADVFRIMGDRLMVDYGKTLSAGDYTILIQAVNEFGDEVSGTILVSVAEAEERMLTLSSAPADRDCWTYYIQDTPSDWLAAHFTDAERMDSDISGWDEDPDGDGMPNWLEFHFGTDGAVGDDLWRPLSGFSSEGRWCIIFPLNPHVEPPIVEVTSDLLSGEWSVLPDQLQWSDSSDVERSIEDLNPAESRKRFFRFRSDVLFE